MSASQKIQVRLKTWTYIIRRNSLENFSHYFPNILKHHLCLRWDGFVSTSLHNNVYVKYHIFCVEMKFTATEKVLRNIWQMLGSTLFKYWLHGRKFNWNSWHSVEYWGNIIKAAYFSFIVYNLIWLFRKNRFPCDISRSHWWKWKSVFQRWLGWDLNLVTMAMAVTTLRIESQTSSRSPRFLWQEE